MSKENNKNEYRYFNKEELEIASKILKISDRFIRMGPKGYVINTSFLNFYDGFKNMEIRPNDVFVATFPRSGTTLTQEIVWLIGNNFDYKKAEVSLTKRFPFVEYHCFFDQEVKNNIYELAGKSEKTTQFIRGMETPVDLANTPSPRFIKSHLPMSLLPAKLFDTGKVVYVARDPRDVVVSFYHLMRFFLMLGYKGTFKDFWYTFINDLTLYGPFFEHIKEAWALRNHPNVLFLFYEEVTKKMPETIKRIVDFLGKEVTKEQIDGLCEHVSVENFKNNESVNFEDHREYGLLREDEKFVRKGKSGGWRDHFDDEMVAKTEEWIAKNLKDTDLRFPSMPNV